MAITPGGSLNATTTSQKQTLSSNYLDLAGTAGEGWAQQYLPDLMEKEAEVFGQRTISGFLSQVGAEEAMQGDQVVWSEQSRLHLSYTGTVIAAGSTSGTFTVISDIDGHADDESGFNVELHGIRVNDIVLLASAGIVVRARVSVVAGAVITVESYETAALTTLSTTASKTRILVVGSEYAKGQSYYKIDGTTETDQRGANEPIFKSFSNKPIIMKDLSLIHI